MKKKNKKTYNESSQMTVTCDLDGRTVAEIREMLAQYPDDAKLVSYTDWYRGMDGPEEFEYFRIVWNEK